MLEICNTKDCQVIIQICLLVLLIPYLKIKKYAFFIYIKY